MKSVKYQGIGSPVFEASLTSSPVNDFATAQHDLYNGNISHLVTAITGYAVQGTAYRYDQLQRLKEMRVFRAADLVKNNSWKGAAETQEYYNSYSYDENGNIQSLKRNGTAVTGLLMDQFAYHYASLGTNPSNRLDYVSDTGADDGTSTAGDIKDMPGSNYTYDKIGALLSDASEGIDEIQWYRGSKKVKRIVRNDADSPEVSFVYNPFGVRIVKVEKPRTGGVLSPQDEWKYTFYTYDANGQNMAVYEAENTADLNVTLKEQAIYGAGRIGLIQQDRLIHSATTTITDPTEIFTNTLGLKNYEITNYLGNVNVVITDRKVKALQTPTITDQVGISVSGGTITRTLSGTGWNAGGASSDQIWQGGGLEWTLGGTMADNQLITLGLSYTNPNASNASVKYAWYTYTSGYPYIVEAGTSVTFFPTTLVAGDKLKIMRECGEIRYYVNGVLKRSVTDPQPLDPMIADFSMNVSGKVIYDLKVQRDAGYEAVVVMKADYYPFGMQMPGRHEESGSYRYGYNGMEKDDEVKGSGNSYDYGARMYDSRIGRFLSLDPDSYKYPEFSPYCYAGNSPVFFTDEDGKGPIVGWKIKSMHQDNASKKYTITIDLKVRRDIILVNQSKMNISQSDGTVVAHAIMKKYCELGVISATFSDKDKHFGFIVDDIRKQYTHIPKDYELIINANVTFVTGNSSYVANDRLIPESTTATLIGIRDYITPTAELPDIAGQADNKGGEACIVEYKYMSPTKQESKTLVLDPYQVTIHELLHLDGASDKYAHDGKPAMPGRSIMKSASQDFTIDDLTAKEICVNYLIAARKGHDVLMGVPNMGNWNKMITPITDSAKYRAKPISGGSVMYDPSIDDSCQDQLKRL